MHKRFVHSIEQKGIFKNVFKVIRILIFMIKYDWALNNDDKCSKEGKSYKLY